MFRRQSGKLEVFLVHPGGPFWAKKDLGAWSIPKGEYSHDEDPLAAAKREFAEEIGFEPEGKFIPLTPVKQKGGKVVSAWAVEGDLDQKNIKSNTFKIEWSPSGNRRSGQQKEFPEVDRADWFDLETAKQKVNQAQAAFLTELEKFLMH